jgi:hypothetical protein
LTKRKSGPAWKTPFLFSGGVNRTSMLTTDTDDKLPRVSPLKARYPLNAWAHIKNCVEVLRIVIVISRLLSRYAPSALSCRSITVRRASPTLANNVPTNKQQTTNNKQQTTNNKQQTTNNKQQTTLAITHAQASMSAAREAKAAFVQGTLLFCCGCARLS